MQTSQNGQTKQTCQLLTAKAVGEMLSLSKRQIFRLNSCGKLPKPLRIGGSVRWANSTIRSWIELSCPDRKVFEAIQETGGIR
jgi:prophage regulatory protein